MKQNKISVKWKIFGYLFAFVALLLLLLWLFQIVFLDDFYRGIKTRSIKSCAEDISKNINSSDLNETLDKLSRDNQIGIKIVSKDGVSLYQSQITPDSVVYKMSENEINEFYNIALESGGSTFNVLTREKIRDNEFINNSSIGIGPPRRKGMESIIYAKVIKKNNDIPVMIMLTSVITPINTTVETLRVQLIYISIILILLSVVLAFFISKKISTPIIKINNSAKELALGNYNTVFKGEGYHEIEELNDTLNYAAKELSKVESLRRELISNISHDLRTPLTMITGYGEVIRDIPGENTPENIQIIIDEAKHLSILVNDILDISKIQSGTQEVKCSRFNLTKSIREMLTRYSKLVENEGYVIEFNYEVDIFINADEVKISQVIYNLINNAITFTGKDKKVVVTQSIDSEFVKIEILDTGEGISSDMLPYIWDRYYKSNKTHKRSSIGTGLGLSIVKGVINMHGGEYGVESIEGEGSVFWVKLKI